MMAAPINLTSTDRDHILRAVATDVDHRLASSNPEAYQQQVTGVIDTILNRVASKSFPSTVKGVLDQKNQFSAINGPKGRGYTVFGSVDNVPDSRIPEGLSEITNAWLDQRVQGKPSSIGGG